MKFPNRPTIALLALALAGGLGAPALAKQVRVLPGESTVASEANPVFATYVGKLSVKAPRSHKGLAIFPITTSRAFPLGNPLTLDEALKGNALKVTELGEGAQVNTLLLENTGKRQIFIMGGEILRGAKQDRTMQNDLLVPPQSGKMKVSVFCTEHGRWVVKSDKFEAADSSVPNSVRGAAKASKDQSAVWGSISRNQERLKVSAPTGAAKEVYEAPKVKADTQPYLDALKDVPGRDVVGVAAAYGGKVIAVDLFGDEALCRRLYPKLLRSYVVDVVGDAWKGSVTEGDVRKLLTTAKDARWTAGTTDGVGKAFEFHVDRWSGSNLNHRDMLFHADMFEGDPPQPANNSRINNQEQRQQNAPPPNLEQRRNRLTR